MEEEEYQGVSFGRIVKVAFHRWKLLLIITFSICLVGFFGVYFGYNYFFNVYGATFSYSGSGLASETMADNTTFDYKSLISKDVLNEVKALKSDYSGIDVDKLVKNNAFTIARNVDKDSGELSYTVSIKRTNMPSEDVARSFFTDLANYPLEKDKAYIANSTFDSALQKYKTVEKYEEAVDLLSTQASMMTTGYNTMRGLKISSALSDRIVSDIYTVNNTLDSSKVTLLRNMIINYGLAPDYTNLDLEALNAEKVILIGKDGTEGEKKDNEELIEDIKAAIMDLAGSVQVTSLSERMESLIVRNHNIDIRVRQINEQIANYNKQAADVEGHAEFMKEITKVYDDLYAEIPEYKAVMNEVYVNNAAVTFENSNVLDVTKNMNIVYSILLPLAAGLVVAIITNLIVDRKMLREEEAPAQ